MLHHIDVVRESSPSISVVAALSTDMLETLCFRVE